jgi:hypothetical protein
VRETGKEVREGRNDDTLLVRALHEKERLKRELERLHGG